MKDEINSRFEELLCQGEALVKNIPRHKGKMGYWLDKEDISKYQAWLGSVVNLLDIVAISGSYFCEESKRLMMHKDMVEGNYLPSTIFQRMYGLFLAAKEDWDRNLLRKIEYIIVAETFDDFLDHASSYHRGNKKNESAVLGSAVLEDTIKKISAKHSIETSGKSIEELIDALVKTDVFTLVKSKRVKGYAGVRNHALHAEWDEFDIRDVGELIKGTRELIEEFL